jgi:hypothetical protein
MERYSDLRDHLFPMKRRNKRFYKRFDTGELDVRCLMLVGEEVMLLKLLPEGALIVSERALESESDYTLQMEREGMTVSVTGRPLSEKTLPPAGEGGEPAHLVAFRFSPALAKGDEDLLGFLDAHSGASTRTRRPDLSVRLLGTAEAARAFESYPVKKISFGGLQVEADRKLPLDSTVRLRLFLPEQRRPVAFNGRVASVLPVTGTLPARYAVGIEYLEMDGKDLLMLKDFIYFIQGL